MKLIRIFVLALLFLFFLVSMTPLPSVLSQNSTGLKIVLKQPLKSIGADGNNYPIYVEIQNIDGEPVQLTNDITIKLFSSDTRVATVPSEVSFPKGAFYTIFYVTTTYNPGTTEITALAPGFESGKLIIKTQLSVGYPKKLAVFVYPKSLIPSPSETAYVVIQLQDSMGKPSRAPTDIKVSLYSSNPLVGSTAVSTLTIPKGKTYMYTTFQPTTIPGSTVITATAEGLESGYASVTTIGPTPEMLVVEAAPKVLPSNGKGASYIYVTAYLVDRNGYPAWASSDIDVVFTSSNTSLAYFQTSTLTIHAGEFYVRNKLYSGGSNIDGAVEITVQAEGLVSARTTIDVKPPSNSTGGSLAVYVSPSVYPPGELTYKDSIIVQVLDSSGYPIIASTSIQVYLSSSNPIYGYPLESSITIVKGVSISTSDLVSSKLVGSTYITAAADNFLSSDAQLEIKAPPPVKIKLGIGPSDIRATGDTYPFLYVQLQDEEGRPTTAQDDIVVELSSSNAQFGNVPDKVTIHRGSSFSIVNFISTTSQGVTNITASATGFEPDSLEVATIEPFPSILAAVSYTSFVADGGTYPVFIQLLDISGRPAKPELPISISLVSSNPNIMSVPSEVTLEEGMPYIMVQVSTSTISGDVTISLAASGYTPTSIDLESILLPLDVELVVSKTKILDNESLQFTVYASHKGLPVEQVQIVVDCNNGEISEGGYTRIDGTYAGVYTPNLPGTDVIRVYASKPGYKSAYKELQIYVDKYITIKVHAETVDGVSIEGVEVTLIDGGGNTFRGVTAADGWVSFTNVKWGYIEVKVGTNYSSSDTKYLFSMWSGDGGNGSTWSGVVIDDITLKALYRVEYFIEVFSDYGNVYGEGWYPKGTAVTIGVDETSIPINPLIYKKFDGWTGDVIDSNPTTTIIVNSPMTINAVWVDDYFYLYIFIGILGIGGGAGFTLFLLYRRGAIFKGRRKPPEEEEEVSLEEYFMVEEERRIEEEEAAAEEAKKIEEERKEPVEERVEETLREEEPVVKEEPEVEEEVKVEEQLPEKEEVEEVTKEEVEEIERPEEEPPEEETKEEAVGEEAGEEPVLDEIEEEIEKELEGLEGLVEEHLEEIYVPPEEELGEPASEEKEESNESNVD